MSAPWPGKRLFATAGGRLRNRLVGQGNRLQERALDLPRSVEVLLSDDKVVALGRAYVGVAGKLLNYIDRQVPGPVGDTRAAHVV